MSGGSRMKENEANDDRRGAGAIAMADATIGMGHEIIITA